MNELNRKIEQVKTTKGAYSLTMRIQKDESALMSIEDHQTKILMRLERVDLELIALLVSHNLHNTK